MSKTGTKNHKKIGRKLLRTDKQFHHLNQRQKEKIDKADIWISEQEIRIHFYQRKNHYRNRIRKEIQKSIREKDEITGGKPLERFDETHVSL